MSKLDTINQFLNKLKVIHKASWEGFTFFCNKCGSDNVSIIRVPETWGDSINAKCSACGYSSGVENTYG